jgi:hypothetical protein
LLVRDLNALGESAQVIPPTTAAFGATRGGRSGKVLDRVEADRLAAGPAERGLSALGVGSSTWS